MLISRELLSAHTSQCICWALWNQRYFLSLTDCGRQMGILVHVAGRRDVLLLQTFYSHHRGTLRRSLSRRLLWCDLQHSITNQFCSDKITTDKCKQLQQPCCHKESRKLCDAACVFPTPNDFI